MPLSSSTASPLQGAVLTAVSGADVETDPFALLRGAVCEAEPVPAVDLPWPSAPEPEPAAAVLAALALVVATFTGHAAVLYDVDGTTRIVEGPQEGVSVAAFLDTVAAAPAVAAGTPAVRLLTGGPADGPQGEKTTACLNVRVDRAQARVHITAPAADLPAWLLRRIADAVLWVYPQLVDPGQRHQPVSEVRLHSPQEGARTAALGRTPPASPFAARDHHRRLR